MSRIEWYKIDSNSVESSLKVNETASDDGRLDTPASSSSAKSNCEIDIIEQAEVAINANRKLGQQLVDAQNEISNIKSALDKNSFSSIITLHETTLKTTIQNYKDRLARKIKDLSDMTQEMLTFRKANRLTRPGNPATLNKTLLYIGFAAVLFFLEVMLNGKLVGSILPGGENEGKLLAMGVAALNTLVPFFVGYYFMKNINLKEDKVIFGTIVFIVMIVILYLNWSYGAFRAIAEVEGGKMNDPSADIEFSTVLMTQLLMQALSPWNIQLTFQGFVLLLIGSSISILLLLEGYYIDDKFPGYGPKQRKLDYLSEEKTNYENEFMDKIGEHKTEIYHKLNNEYSRLTDLVNRWSDLVNQFQTNFDNYDKITKSNEVSINHCLDHYRSKNAELRTTPPPKYFNEPFKYSDSILNSHTFFSDTAQAYMIDDHREKQKKQLESDIAFRYGVIQKNADELIKKYDKIIKEELIKA